MKNSAKRFLTTVLFLFFFSGLLSLQAQSVIQDGEIIAVVDAEKLSWADVENKEINALRQKLYQLTRLQLQKTAIQKLAQKYSAYAIVPNLKVPEKKLKALYEENNLASRGSYQELRPHLEAYYQQLLEKAHWERLFRKAVAEGKIDFKLQRPENFKVRVRLGDAVLRGNKQAEVMVLEFSDYQCPYCERVQATVADLRKKYQQRVVFSYKHLPLPFHSQAMGAANAVECARQQGRFEAYHQSLFANNQHLQTVNLKKYARQISIENPVKFDRCLAAQKYEKRIRKDLEEAQRLGINGTPTFVVGRYLPQEGVLIGEIMSGAIGREQFVEIIEQYLKEG